MPKLSIMDRTGHTVLTWTDEEASVAATERTFNDLKAKGYKFWLLNETGGKGKSIKKFHKESGSLIFEMADGKATKKVKPAKDAEVIAAPPSSGG